MTVFKTIIVLFIWESANLRAQELLKAWGIQVNKEHKSNVHVLTF